MINKDVERLTKIKREKLAVHGFVEATTLRHHGMSVCGGWELTAQHLGISSGHIYPVDLSYEEIHEAIQLYKNSLITQEGQEFKGSYAGKINMGVGGVNACVICKTWDAD